VSEGWRGSKSTLTNLYNACPTWPDLAHKRLDEAVFAAYGWKSDLSDEEILEKLLALNLERAKNYCHCEPQAKQSPGMRRLLRNERSQ
jgi:hypothetical protein